MKPLIAVTCVAVIAAIGYAGWGEYSKAKILAQRYAMEQSVVSWRVDNRDRCLREIEIFGDLQRRRLDSEESVNMCLSMGAIDESDINAFKERRGY